MRIYLAGLYSRPDVWERMKIYIATGCHDAVNDYMKKIYLAGQRPWEETGIYNHLVKDKICILDSFYYIKDWCYKYLKVWDFMLDSGAFTFMENDKGNVNWESYVDRYSDFINEHDINLYFEMDIDSVTNLKYVEKLRKRMEKRTNKQSIPVWHRSRGKDYFISMCKDYDYVSLGGIVSGEWKGSNPDIFQWFIDKAHEHNCKIHALGYTNMKGLKKYNFDSVDSTTWVSGNRFGHLWHFKNGEIKKVHRQENQKMINPQDVAVQNFHAWVLFQKYAIKYY